jgi:hypothetical protein
MTGKHEDIAAIQDLNAKQQAAALEALRRAEAAKAAAAQQGKR